MKVLKIIGRFFLFLFLTLLTQIAGLVYLLSFAFDKPLEKLIKNRLVLPMVKFLVFLLLYTLATFLVVPLLAKPFGRVPLLFLKRIT